MSFAQLAVTAGNYADVEILADIDEIESDFGPDPLNEVVAALSDMAAHTAEIELETFRGLWDAVRTAESGHPEPAPDGFMVQILEGSETEIPFRQVVQHGK